MMLHALYALVFHQQPRHAQDISHPERLTVAELTEKLAKEQGVDPCELRTNWWQRLTHRTSPVWTDIADHCAPQLHRWAFATVRNAIRSDEPIPVRPTWRPCPPQQVHQHRAFCDQTVFIAKAPGYGAPWDTAVSGKWN